MSLGAISRETHEVIAVAMNRIGGKSNSGEGGEVWRKHLPFKRFLVMAISCVTCRDLRIMKIGIKNSVYDVISCGSTSILELLKLRFLFVDFQSFTTHILQFRDHLISCYQSLTVNDVTRLIIWMWGRLLPGSCKMEASRGRGRWFFAYTSSS